MPFQVTFAQKAIPSGIIQFVSAGPDENAICDLSFSLEATVIGDLNGHTVLWEQITGNPVTFTTPVNQLAISYNQSTFEDKTFRFWVDKGTSSQRFDDVTVFGSPTSIIDDVPYSTNSSKINTTVEFDGDSHSMVLLPPLPTVYHTGFSISKTYTVASLLWEPPPHTNLTVIGYVVKERDPSGTWTDVATLPATASEYSGIVIGKMYQLDVVYRYPNSYIGRTGSNVILANGILQDAGIIGVDAITSHYSVSKKSALIEGYDIETLSIVTKDAIIDNNFTGYSPRSGISDYDATQLFLIGKIYTDDDYVSYSPTRGAITDFDVTVLIGGQVGGS